MATRALLAQGLPQSPAVEVACALGRAAGAGSEESSSHQVVNPVLPAIGLRPRMLCHAIPASSR